MPSPRFHPALRLIFCATGALFLSSIVYLVIKAGLAATTPLTGRAVSFDTFAERNPLAAGLLFYPPTLLWIWFCRSAFDRRSVGSLGLRVAGAGRGFFAGALGGMLAISLLFGVLCLTGHVAVSGPSPEAVRAGTPATIAILVFFALAFFAVGLTEEIVFRGYALHNLAAWMGVTAAVIVQAVVFALVHLGNVLGPLIKVTAAGAVVFSQAEVARALADARWGLLNIALIGVFFALCYLKTGSLWFPIGFHATWNFCLGCIFSFPVSGIKVFRALDVAVSPNALVTGGSFGAEGSALLSVLIAVMSWMVWQQPSHTRAALDLASLRGAPDATQMPDTSLIPPAETPASADADSESEHAPPRFQTTMRPAARTAPLDRSALEALQALNNRIPLPDLAPVKSQNTNSFGDATGIAVPGTAATASQSNAAANEAPISALPPSSEAFGSNPAGSDSAPAPGEVGATANSASAPIALPVVESQAADVSSASPSLSVRPSAPPAKAPSSPDSAPPESVSPKPAAPVLTAKKPAPKW